MPRRTWSNDVAVDAVVLVLHLVGLVHHEPLLDVAAFASAVLAFTVRVMRS